MEEIIETNVVVTDNNKEELVAQYGEIPNELLEAPETHTLEEATEDGLVEEVADNG